jgi:hypothetical protein
VTVGMTSPSKAVTVTNNSQSSAVTLNLPILASGDYKIVSTTCTGSLAAKSKCSFSVTFSPTAKVAISGVASVSYKSLGSPQVVDLTGTGQ